MLKPFFPLPTLHEAANAATLGDVVDGILHVVAQLLNARLAVIARVEDTTYTVMAVVDQHHAVRPGQMYNLQDTFCVHMLETGHPLHIADTLHVPGPLRCVPTLLELNVRSYIGVPLSLADGRVFGSLWAADTDAYRFDEQDLALLQLFARLLTHELDQDAQSRHQERIEQVASMQADIDPLTGLLSRTSFEAMLARETARRSRYGGVYAVAVLQIDSTPNFPPPDADHAVDSLRQGLADILMRTSRLVDCCARIDNDRFAVLFLETTASGVAAWRTRIETAIDAWNRVHAASDLALDVRIGIADCHDAPPWLRRTTAMLDLAQQRVIDEVPHPTTH